MVLSFPWPGATLRLLQNTFLFWGKSKLKGDENHALLFPLRLVPATRHRWGKKHVGISQLCKKDFFFFNEEGRLCCAIPVSHVAAVDWELCMCVRENLMHRVCVCVCENQVLWVVFQVHAFHLGREGISQRGSQHDDTQLPTQFKHDC